MDIILSHTHSDFDALGATVAASRLYPEAVPVLHPDLDRQVRAYAALHKEALRLQDLAALDLATVRRVIVVDTQSPSRLGAIDGLRERKDVEWVVYDHHPSGAQDLPPGPGRRERVGAATTLLTQELERRGVSLSPLEATTMALGIYADTGQLTHPGTTPADARALAYLLEAGADLAVIAHFSQVRLTGPQQALLQALLEAAPIETIGGHAVLVAGVAWPEEVSDLSLVAHQLLALQPVDVLLMVVETRGRTQIVARSQLPECDLRRVLAPYEGRGHAQAASAHAKDLPVAEALATVRARLPEALPVEPSASDLMSTPVRTIDPDASAVEAERALFRYGHHAFVVVDGARVVGLVTRRDLDRAIHHGLGDQPIKGFMTRQLVTVAPQTLRAEIERLMIAHDIGRLPVLSEGALLGIVTRSDVLRVLYAHRQANRLAVRRTTDEVAEKLRSVWPETWRDLVARVGAIAGERPLYLVGGAVRDLMLDRPNLDVDLVVEGDAIALAREVAAAFSGAELHTHAPFGTASLSLPDGRKLDLATARTEWYTHPGALPTVEFASLKRDLARRDFSVNALAVRLNPAHYGELIDFFSSRGDLARGILRVLHNLSFIEDPTRLLRGVRFEQQLGFRLDAESEAYARYAMATGRFDGIGGERNKVEWRRIFSLADPLPAARRIGALDGWRMLHPALRPGSETFHAFRRLRHLARRLDPGFSRWQSYMIILLAPLGEQDASGVLRRLNLSGSEIEAICAGLRAIDSLAPLDDWRTLTPAHIYARLKPFEGPALAALAAWCHRPAARRAVWRYWRELRHIRLAVGGDGLKELGLSPGPRYGQILKAVLDARLNGEVASEAEERALMAALIAGPGEGPPC